MVRLRLPRCRKHWLAAAAVLVACATVLIWWRPWKYLGLEPIRISRETTYIDGPLREDGTIDYRAAWNAKISAGVTPENNAVVLIWQAMGPNTEELAKVDSDQFFRELGIEPPAADGAHFITLEAFIDGKQDELRDEARRRGGGLFDGNWGQQSSELESGLHAAEIEAMKRPWSREEYPLLEEWIALNANPLKKVVEASRRERYFAPLMYPSGPEDESFLIVAPAPTEWACRDLARALLPRAMRRTAEGDFDAAWDDLLACHRLARLLDQSRSFDAGMRSNAIEKPVCYATAHLLWRNKSNRALLAKMAADLDGLSPPARMSDWLERDRYEWLDMALKFRNSHHVPVDWNALLIEGNQWHDRYLHAAGLPAYRDCLSAWIKLSDESEQFETADDDSKFVLLRKKLLQQANPRNYFVPVVYYTDAALFGLERAAVALAEFAAAQGEFPARLDELVPKYLPVVPTDPFANDAPLHYKRTDDGFVLYSFGGDRKDDGGQDYLGGVVGDIVIRFPPRLSDPPPPPIKKRPEKAADDADERG